MSCELFLFPSGVFFLIFFFYIPKDEFKSTLHFFFVFTVEDDSVVGQLVFVEDLFQLAARAGIHVMRSGSVALIKVEFVWYRCIIAKKVVCLDLESLCKFQNDITRRNTVLEFIKRNHFRCQS